MSLSQIKVNNQVVTNVDSSVQNTDNLIMNSAVNSKLNTIILREGYLEQYENFKKYVSNVYILPKGQEQYEYLVNLNPQRIMISYYGVRNSSLGGSLSIFGLQIYLADDNVATYSIREVPDLSKRLIWELPVITEGYGELHSRNYRIFVEFNRDIDFDTPTSLFDSGPYFYIFDAVQIPLIYSIINNDNSDIIEEVQELSDSVSTLSSELNSKASKLTRTIVDTNIDILKNVKIDYCSMRDIIEFPQNLVDKDNIIDGYYYELGSYRPFSVYSATLIPIPLQLGQTYTSNYGNLSHIDVIRCDTFQTIQHIAYNLESDFWNVVYNSSNNTFQFTIPSDLTYEVCGLFSMQTNIMSEYKVVKGTDLSIANKFIVQFRNPYIPEVTETKNYIVVDINGNGDYTSLTAATDACADGATILVMPGIYDNEVIVGGKTKTLFIIGVDRDKCVIKNNHGIYSDAVIHISSGLLRNLTVYQYGTNAGQSSGSYGVHADFNTMYNSTLRIENCTLRSDVPNTGGIGIGLRGNGKLTIKSCHLISGTSNRALYAHDNNNPGYDGEQWLIVEDCVIEAPNANDQAVIIQGQGKNGVRTFSESQYYIEFIRNRIIGTCGFVNWYSNDVTITDDDFQGVMNLRLSSKSWGNSASILNAE